MNKIFQKNIPPTRSGRIIKTQEKIRKMHSKMNPARVDREDERRMLPCRNFCRFYHPLASSIPTVIRVPNLPSSFQQNSFGQFPVHSGPHSVFSLSPTQSSRSHMGMSPKMGGMGTPGSSRLLGMNGFGNNYSRSHTAPAAAASPSYSEYEMAYMQQMEIQKEKERRAAAPPPPETEETLQNTVFSHIDWKEFLTPGARPPPPTHVPYMSNSPSKAAETLDSLESLIRSAGTGNPKISHPMDLARTNFFAERLAAAAERERELQAGTDEDCPDGKLPSPPKIREFISQLKHSRVLSAKEELQMKVKQIAKELAAEPAQHVQSLDTFFRNYTFQSIPTAPSSEQDLISPEAKQAVSESRVHGINEVMDIDLNGCKSETITLPKNAFSSSDSGISTEFDSGHSASSLEYAKENSDGNKTSDESPQA